MKIVSVRCPCSITPQPIEHYFTAPGCPNPPLPIPMIRGIVAMDAGDKEHKDNNITVTRLLTCPREIVIHDNMEVGTIDLVTLVSVFRGKLWHSTMEKYAGEDGYTEVTIPLPGQKPPTFLGIPIRGTIDFIKADMTEIDDYKDHSESAQKFVYDRSQKDGILTDDAVQLNIYRHLLEKAIPGTKIKKMRVHHTAMVSARGPRAAFTVDAPFLTESQIGTFKPKGGVTTVAEIIDLYLKDQERQKQGVGVKDRARLLPLTGRTMFNNKKCLSYCSVREICDRLEGITFTDV